MRQKLMLSGLRVYMQTLFLLSSERGAEKVLQLFSKPLIRKIRKRDAESLQTAEQKLMSIGEGREVMTYRWGAGARGVLCVHGWESNAGNFGGFVAPFLEKGFSVFAFDAPAHGYSPGKTTNIFQYKDAIEKLLTNHPEIDTIVSHSFGSAASLYALTVLKDHRIKKLSMLTVPDRMLDFLNQVFVLLNLSERQQELVLKKFESRFGFPISYFSSARAVGELSVAIQVLHDRHEQILPFSDSERVVAGARDGRLEVLEHVGHYRMLWESAVVGKVVEFVS
ncbi:MAG: alpha/beta hydrolase [Bacteroidia bacterium]